MQIRNVTARMRQRNGIAAVISRGNQSCSCTLVLGHNANEADDQQSYSVEADEADLLIAAAEYKPTGTATRPQIDDRIAATVNGAARIWRVIVRGGNQQTHLTRDPEGTELRVFAKLF